MGALELLIAKYPGLASALAGSAAGAPIGAIFSPEGSEGRGALRGALMGGGVGLTGTKLLRLLRDRPPTAPDLLSLAAGTGAFGGYVGRVPPTPVVTQGLSSEPETAGLSEEGTKEPAKEASLMSGKVDLAKQAEEEKVAADRTSAFGAGMDIYFKEAGVKREDLAKHAGLKSPEELTGATITWLNAAMEQHEAKQATSAQA